ncbi:hypothetical protein KAF25_000702 [Fusarium avenaceum]|uniref:Uncharacterized protein n=1 Tax=Fusarium avenaceum TaxID=40199 RepID=A0A9P7KM91_9HYPO|nr:hypothetical protein KAF25_000702 [Fusarium avenaceum]
MHSSTRPARRLQTVDIDELSDYKLGVASMAGNIAPKRRGRPPKPRPYKKSSTSKLCGSLPGTRLRGRPRKPAKHSIKQKNVSKNVQHVMSDQQIAKKLGWVMRRPTMGKRFGDASRAVFWLSGQWPWDLTAGFLPKKWGIQIMENLRRLFRTVHRHVATVDYGHNFQVVKDYLQDCATKRDGCHPHLRNSDVTDACDYFSAHDYRSEVVQTTTVRTQIRCITTLSGPGEDSGDDEGDDDDCEDHSDGDIDSDTASSEDEWEDWVDYQYTDDEETAMECTVAIRKRSRSSSVLSRAPKRVCTSDTDAAGDDMDDVMSFDASPSVIREVNPRFSHPRSTMIEHTQSHSHSDLAHTPNLADLIPALESLQLEKEKQLDAATRSLHEITASIQTSELSTLQSSASSRIIDNLCSDMKRYETEREKILKGRKFVEEHHDDMGMGVEDIAKTMQKYDARLGECDQLIAQANADVLEELELIAQQGFDLKAEERRLCVHHQRAIEEVMHCQTIGTLTRLGSSGMTTLLLELEEKNIDLVGLAEAIMAEGAVAAKEQHSSVDDFP